MVKLALEVEIAVGRILHTVVLTGTVAVTDWVIFDFAGQSNTSARQLVITVTEVAQMVAVVHCGFARTVLFAVGHTHSSVSGTV